MQQGIFDFSRIDAVELADVYQEGVAGLGFLIMMHKRTLLCLRDRDRVLENCISPIGASPYLLLPQAALLHNEVLICEAVTEDEILRKELRSRSSYLEEYDASIEKIHRLLIQEYLTNIFHYRAVRELFDQAQIHKGLTFTREKLLEDHKVFKEDVDQRAATYERRHQLLTVFVVTVLTIIQGFASFQGIWTFNDNDDRNQVEWYWRAAFVQSSLLLCTLFVLWRWYLQTNDHRARERVNRKGKTTPNRHASTRLSRWRRRIGLFFHPQ
jgi:hypothetical protein